MKKRVLFCPMDWGLGHASRLIPLIREYRKDHAVFIACSEKIAAFYKIELPDCETILLKSPVIRYSPGNFFFFTMLLQMPKLFASIFSEHSHLKKIVEEYRIDQVISDNRYGLWNKHCHTVFITHQLSPFTGTKFTDFIAKKIVAHFANRFDECWIPDNEHSPRISGKLSENTTIRNVRYIGFLSRFEKTENTGASRQLLILLSGPEPQRTILENLLLEKTRDLPFPKIIVRGKPEETRLPVVENFIFYNHLKSEELQALILESHFIICRSGYSSVMDLITLGKPAILIPTPHQYEQEYLAKHLQELGLFEFQTQDAISLDHLLQEQ